MTSSKRLPEGGPTFLSGRSEFSDDMFHQPLHKRKQISKKPVFTGPDLGGESKSP